MQAAGGKNVRRKEPLFPRLDDDVPTAPQPQPQPPPADDQGGFGAGIPKDLEALLAKARRGDTACLPELRKALDAHPELWQRYGDLGAAIERALIAEIADADLILAESVVRRADAMRRELAATTPLEKLQVDRVVSAWLQIQQAQAAMAACQDKDTRLQRLRTQQVDAAERRFQAATRGLALTRRLLGAKPTGSAGGGSGLMCANLPWVLASFRRPTVVRPAGQISLNRAHKTN
jgi:hypothetical protein